MQSSHRITINGETIIGRRGGVLLDTALSNNVKIPFDCRSGHCGTCKVRVVEGKVKGGESGEAGVVHACQCRIVADATIEVASVPDAQTTEGVVHSLKRLAPDVVQVIIQPERAVLYLPGQYIRVGFRGYPTRAYSLTLPVHGRSEGNTVCLHVRQIPGGRVSSALGRKIRPGHRVRLTGPFGSAYFRPDMDNRMILVCSGTGFAPIWAIATAALQENFARPIMLIAGARTLQSLYMFPALRQIRHCPNVRILPVTSEPQRRPTGPVRIGRPTDFLPRLHPTDIVYACGVPGMVDAVKEMAARAGALCLADPFLPSDDQESEGLLSRAMDWFSAGRQQTVPPRAARAESNRGRPAARARTGARSRGAPPPGRMSALPAPAFRR